MSESLYSFYGIQYYIYIHNIVLEALLLKNICDDRLICSFSNYKESHAVL